MKPLRIASIAGRFPRLEHLEVYVFTSQRTNFVTCLESNPQLRSLRISSNNLGQNILSSIAAHPQLQNLCINHEPQNDNRQVSNPASIRFGTVATFKINNLKHLENRNIFLTFDRLSEVRITSVDSSLRRFFC